jgi:hypothetical protein
LDAREKELAALESELDARERAADELLEELQLKSVSQELTHTVQHEENATRLAEISKFIQRHRAKYSRHSVDS